MHYKSQTFTNFLSEVIVPILGNLGNLVYS